MSGTNFIHKSRPKSDRERFFGPIDRDDTFIVFDDTWTMANIFVKMGLAPSLTQARKQGMGSEIPSGFTIGREKAKNPGKNFWVLR